MNGWLYRLPLAWCYVVCRHPIYWVLLVWTLLTAVDCFAYIYPELCTDALTSQLPVMSTH